MLPFPIRFAILTDLATNAIGAVVGPHHVMLVQAPMAEFGILVAAGIVVHELTPTVGQIARWLHRWWRRRR